MPRAIALIGAPSSAGAFAPGQEDAPAALREAGLAQLLFTAGASVEDRGDVEGFRWVPDRERPRAMHAAHVARVALAVADAVQAALHDGLLPVVLGGDCTVGVGSFLGVRRAHAGAGLVHLDPHPDCNTPESVRDGALDWMGVAHLLGLPGALPEIVGLDGAGPALAPNRLVLLGASPERSQPGEREAIARLSLSVVAEADVAADPEGAAARALRSVDGERPYALHVDSDAIDFADLPICENTDRNVGLPFATAMRAMRAAAAGPGLAAVTITEVNPHHGEPGGATIAAFAEGLAGALA